MHKKAQITAFIILGLVIVATAAFFISTSQKAKLQAIETQADELISELKNKQTIDYYVNLCLRQVAENSLELAGSQGGRIYKHQGGRSSDAETHDVMLMPIIYSLDGKKLLNISYSMFRPVLGGRFPVVPDYPYPNQPLHNRVWKYGESRLAPLCDPNGPNQQYTGTYGPYTSCRAEQYSRPQLPGFQNISLQQDLKAYVENNTQSCVNLSVLSFYTGLNVTPGIPNATVIFTPDTVVFELDYPLIIISQRLRTMRSLKFSSAIPVRLLAVHDELLEFIKLERTKLFFNYSLHEFKTGRKEMTIARICPLCGQNVFDEVIRITDPSSTLKGKPFFFQAAIQNRIPALDWIHLRGADPFNASPDIVVLTGMKINISPQGFDPDERNNPRLTYNYSGWKETYDTWFDLTCCNSVDCGNFDDMLTCIKPVNPPREPHAWTLSSEFVATQREASYLTKDSDIGLHEVNVSVTDPGGLTDYQTVKILVIETPKAIQNNSNNYSDINDGYASLEDPYYLDPQLSTGAAGAIIEYTWRDLIGAVVSDFEIIVDQPPVITHQLPNISMFSNSIGGLTGHCKTPIYGIKNLSCDISDKQYFNKFWTLGIHTIELEILTQVGSGITPAIVPASEKKDIEVRACLPHKGYGLVYPYNNLTKPWKTGSYEAVPAPAYNVDPNPLNPFQANHSCCLGEGPEPTDSSWGTYAPDTIKCFDTREFGINIAFEDYHFFTAPPPGHPWSAFSDITADEINDVIDRRFHRFCSGERGNICSGPVTDIRSETGNYNIVCRNKHHETGRDLNGTEEERCTAACPDNSSECPPITNALYYKTYGCYNYSPMQSFEKNVLHFGYNHPDLDTTTLTPYSELGTLPKAADGICNDVKECSDFNSDTPPYDTFFAEYGEFTIGEYDVDSALNTGIKCPATCDSAGGCKAAVNMSCECETDCAANFWCDGINPGEVSSDSLFYHMCCSYHCGTTINPADITDGSGNVIANFISNCPSGDHNVDVSGGRDSPDAFCYDEAPTNICYHTGSIISDTCSITDGWVLDKETQCYERGEVNPNNGACSKTPNPCDYIGCTAEYDEGPDPSDETSSWSDTCEADDNSYTWCRDDDSSTCYTSVSCSGAGSGWVNDATPSDCDVAGKPALSACNDDGKLYASGTKCWEGEYCTISGYNAGNSKDCRTTNCAGIGVVSNLDSNYCVKSESCILGSSHNVNEVEKTGTCLRCSIDNTICLNEGVTCIDPASGTCEDEFSCTSSGWTCPAAT
ncbi:hypothetical protein ACFL0W_06320 [Nanoarchaeota archaeon]